MSEFRVDLEPLGRRVKIKPGSTLLDAAQAAGAELISLCGGAGTCRCCRVKLVSGKLSPLNSVEIDLFDKEEIEAGYRLACQAVPQGHTRVYIPPESLTTPQRLQLEGSEAVIVPEPVIETADLRLNPADLHDLRSDACRLREALVESGRSAEVTIRLPILSTLSDQLRAQDWSLRLVLRQGEAIAALPSGSRALGLAVDIGTTKLAAYLVDLADGKLLAKQGAMNPQIAYGEDVVSRIAYTVENEGGRKILQSMLVKALNKLLYELCEEAEVAPEQVVEAVAVGNTAMHHLFAGLPVRQLGLAPYVPAVSDPLDFSAGEIGLDLAPGAYVHLPPNIAGYVGADHVAMLLATESWSSKSWNSKSWTKGSLIAIDIGTNTEITLAAGGRLLSCSCASGPAFEGAHLQDGMRAAPGAIERVSIEKGGIRYHTIADRPPVGICGSGILDAVSGMIGAGIIDDSGKFRMDSPLVRTKHEKQELVLSPSSSTGHRRDIVVTRKDVNEIQLAKAAIRAGINILLKEAGLAADDIREFIIAGAFGTYLDLGSAVRIGMFPPLPLGRFRQVGNAAGIGAKQMLISAARRSQAAEIARRVNYIELTTHPYFTPEFLKAMYFPCRT